MEANQDIVAHVNEESAADVSCCCGCRAKCNYCREFQEVTLDEMLHNTTAGDMLLFENGCSCGTCCIGCWTRSEFDHVGIIYHGATATLATSFGKSVQVLYDTPMLAEAMSPKCLAGPLKAVIQSVWKNGGQVYWRKITRPLMEGEPTKDKKAEPKGIPAKANRIYGEMMALHEMEAFARVTQIDGADGTVKWKYHVASLQEKVDKNAQLNKKERSNVVPVDVLNEEEMKVLNAKEKDTLKENDKYHLRNTLTYREWNQSCANLSGTSYEGHSGDLIKAALTQDSGCWTDLFCECCECCDRGVSDDEKMTLQQRQNTEDSLFCSELVALQLLRAGWRQGKDMSDKYLPKDMTDDPHETLSADLAKGVSYGGMLQIVPDATCLSVPKESKGHDHVTTAEEASPSETEGLLSKV